MGFLNMDLPETKFNDFLQLITRDIGIFSLIPIALTFITNSIFSNKLIFKNWIHVHPFVMKIIYNIIDMLFEYTAICLTNISSKLVSYNIGMAFTFSLLFG